MNDGEDGLQCGKQASTGVCETVTCLAQLPCDSFDASESLTTTFSFLDLNSDVKHLNALAYPLPVS